MAPTCNVNTFATGAESHAECRMHTYDVEVERDGRWWMVKIPETDGLTQARWLGEAESMARSYIAVSTGQPIGDVHVRIVKVTGRDIGFLRRVVRRMLG
jgi:hypothetical protein